MAERYETGTAVRVTAHHVMPGRPPPEGQPHSHDYRITVRVQRDRLDEAGMVVDLDALSGALQGVVGRLAGADLDATVGAHADSDSAVGADAGRSGPVTVEAFARWLHGRLAGELARRLGPMPGAVLAVRVYESTEEYGGYTAPLPGG